MDARLLTPGPLPFSQGREETVAPDRSPASAPDRTSSGPAPPERNGLSWPVCAQLAAVAFVLSLCGLLFVLTIARRELPAAEPLFQPIDLNRAGRAELMSLPGIGEKLAQRIEEHRARHGPFLSIDELRKVSGIGPVILERLRPWVQVDEGKHFSFYHDPQSLPAAPAPAGGQFLPSPRGFEDSAPATPQGQEASRRTNKQAALTGTVNVNTASLAELQRLPGIGPKLSQRIVEERTKRPFATAEDLDRVPGIGKKTVEKLRPHVTFGEK